MTDLTAMRAAYEAWAIKWHGRDYILKNPSGSYCVASIEHDWRIWQAAWNAKPAAQVSEAVASTWDDPRFQKLAFALYAEGLNRDSSGHVQTTALANYIDARGAAHPATEQADVPTWQERIIGDTRTYAVDAAKNAEIADLRAALAKRGQL
jgi:hypothetical protein